MYAIFQALRAMVNPGRSQESALNAPLRSYQPRLRQALYDLESGLRGMQNYLHAHAGWAQQAAKAGPARNARDKAQDLMYQVFNALLDEPQAQWPQDDAFKAFLTATDDTGFLSPLLHWGLASCPALLKFKRAEHDPLRGPIIERAFVVDGKLSVSVGFDLLHKEVHICASRTIEHPDARVQTIEGLVRVRNNIIRQIRDLSKKAENFPEFTPEKRKTAEEAKFKEALAQSSDFRRRLEQLLRGYDSTTRALLAENWNRFKP